MGQNRAQWDLWGLGTQTHGHVGAMYQQGKQETGNCFPLTAWFVPDAAFGFSLALFHLLFIQTYGLPELWSHSPRPHCTGLLTHSVCVQHIMILSHSRHSFILPFTHPPILPSIQPSKLATFLPSLHPPSILPSILLSIHPSSFHHSFLSSFLLFFHHPAILPSIPPSILPSTHPSTIHPSVLLSIHLFFHPSKLTYLLISTIQPSIYPSIHPRIHKSIHSSIRPFFLLSIQLYIHCPLIEQCSHSACQQDPASSFVSSANEHHITLGHKDLCLTRVSIKFQTVATTARVMVLALWASPTFSLVI